MLLVLAAGAAGCASETSLPDDYLGQWYYTGSSGGISGAGAGDAAIGYIVITARNTIERYEDDGRLLATEFFELDRGETIFSSDELWILREPDGMDRVIQLHDDGTLAISDHAYDGFHLGYARSR
jgi:hypothetical protein